MSTNTQITQAVDTIYRENPEDKSLAAALSAAWINAHYKGEELKILDLRGLSALTDFFVISTANNPTQGQSMCEEVAYQLKRKGLAVKSIEGREAEDWSLVDMGDIILHVFQETHRTIYDLDGLWARAPRVSIPSEYYMGSREVPQAQKVEEGYF